MERKRLNSAVSSGLVESVQTVSTGRYLPFLCRIFAYFWNFLTFFSTFFIEKFTSDSPNIATGFQCRWIQGTQEPDR